MFYNISQSLHHKEDPWSSIIHVFVWLDQECLYTLFLTPSLQMVILLEGRSLEDFSIRNIIIE